MRSVRWVSLLLEGLVCLLIFEGLLRKLLPPLALPIFFLKDAICLVLLYLVVRLNLKDNPGRLWQRWSWLVGLLIPCLLVTFLYDPVLMFFGGKQYLLYGVVGIAASAVWPILGLKSLSRLGWIFVAAVVVTTFVAVLQNRLPGSHWLNLSVGGESLEAFSAAGKLRVSSTFSFNSQFSAFLNFAPVFIAVWFLFCRRVPFRSVILLGLMTALLVANFVTGSRGAVVGSAAVLASSMALMCVRLRPSLLMPVIGICLAVYIILPILKTSFPDLFAAYEARSAGYGGRTHTEELSERILGSFRLRTENVDVLGSVFGHGLGTMSNGVDKISGYARQIRLSGFWTETDFQTTLYEGGFYLTIVWYGFRITMIMLCIRNFFFIQETKWQIIAAMSTGFVLVQGIFGVLAIQPPVQIWWWLAIALNVVSFTFDNQEYLSHQSETTANGEEMETLTGVAACY